MTTAVLSIAETFVARLSASPSIGIENIRRSHRTPVTREDSPAIQIEPGRIRRNGNTRGNCIQRVMRVKVSVIVRDDTALDALDPFLETIAKRLDPATPGFMTYGRGVMPDLDAVDFDEEIADQDAIRCDLEYDVVFWTNENSLTVVA